MSFTKPTNYTPCELSILITAKPCMETATCRGMESGTNRLYSFRRKRYRLALCATLAFCEPPRSNLHSLACMRAFRLASFDTVASVSNRLGATPKPRKPPTKKHPQGVLFCWWSMLNESRTTHSIYLMRANPKLNRTRLVPP